MGGRSPMALDAGSQVGEGSSMGTPRRRLCSKHRPPLWDTARATARWVASIELLSASLVITMATPPRLAMETAAARWCARLTGDDLVWSHFVGLLMQRDLCLRWCVLGHELDRPVCVCSAEPYTTEPYTSDDG